MSDPTKTLIRDARGFLSELAQNNSREWFLEHKPRYEGELKAPATALLDQVAAGLEREFGAPVAPKLFRPHRDVRFSKDKTPYHVHLHMGWSADGLGWWFGISPDYVSTGAGVMGFDKAQLEAWRQKVAGPDGAGIANMLAALMAEGARVGEPELKRVPAPFDKEHPQAELLRRKSLGVWFDGEGDISVPLADRLIARFRALRPVTDMLGRL